MRVEGGVEEVGVGLGVQVVVVVVVVVVVQVRGVVAAVRVAVEVNSTSKSKISGTTQLSIIPNLSIQAIPATTLWVMTTASGR